jgi:hypothetical protein
MHGDYLSLVSVLHFWLHVAVHCDCFSRQSASPSSQGSAGSLGSGSTGLTGTTGCSVSFERFVVFVAFGLVLFPDDLVGSDPLPVEVV